MGRELVLRVTLKDCRVDTFHAGGKGGQNQNTRDTGVRIVHPPSGAVGESREERSQLQNKKTAFKRMAEHPKFRVWLNRELNQDADINRGYLWKFENGHWVHNNTNNQIPPHEIKIEHCVNGCWVPEPC